MCNFWINTYQTRLVGYRDKHIYDNQMRGSIGAECFHEGAASATAAVSCCCYSAATHPLLLLYPAAVSYRITATLKNRMSTLIFCYLLLLLLNAASTLLLKLCSRQLQSAALLSNCIAAAMQSNCSATF